MTPLRAQWVQFIMFKKKNKDNLVKIQFNIHFLSLKDIPAGLSGKELYIECKRGKKPANHKNTRHFSVKDKEYDINDNLSFACSLEKKDKRYEPKKKIMFSLMDEDKRTKKAELVSRAEIDLSVYAEPGTIRSEPVTLMTKDKKKAGVLHIRIESVPLRMNGKAVVPVSQEAAPTGKERINIGGQSYQLQTSDEITETQGSDDEGESDFPDEDQPSLAQKRLSMRVPRGVSTTSAGSIQSSATDSALQDMKKDNYRMSKRVEKLELELKEARETKGNALEDSENADLRRDKSRLEAKVSKLQQELMDLRTSSPVMTRESGTSASSAAMEMEKQLTAVLEEKRKVEDELEDSKRNLRRETSSHNQLKDEMEQLNRKYRDLEKQSEDGHRDRGDDLERKQKELNAREKQIIELEVQLKSYKKEAESNREQSQNERDSDKERKLREYEIKVRNAESETARLNDEIAALKRASIDHNEKNESLREEKERYRMECEAAKREATESREELNETKKAQRKAEETSRQATQENVNLSKRITELENELREMKERESDKRKDVMSEGAAKAEYEKEMNSLKSKMEKTAAEKEALDALVKELNHKISELEGERNTERGQKDDYKEKMEKMGRDHESERADLRSKVTDRKKEAQEKSEQLSKIEKELENEREKTREMKRLEDDLQREKERSKAALAAAAAASVGGSAELENERERNKTLEKKLREVEEQLQQTKEEHSTLVDRHEKKQKEYKREIEELNSQVNNSKEEATSRSVLASAGSAELEKEREKREQEEKKRRELEEEIQFIKTDQEKNNKRGEKRQKELEEKVMEYEQKVDELKKKIHTLEEQTEEKKDRDASANQESEKERRRADEMERQKSKLEKRIKELEQEHKERGDSMTEQHEREMEKMKQKVREEKIKSDTLTSAAAVAVSSEEMEREKKRADEAEEAQKELNEKIHQLEEEVSELSDRASEAKKLKKKVNKKDEEIEELRQQLEKANEKKSGELDEEAALKLKIQAKRLEKEVEGLKKRKENEMKTLIETGVYSADVEYDKEVPVGVRYIVERVMDMGLIDPIDEDFTNALLNSIRKSFARSAYDSETLTYWLSFTLQLYDKLRAEISEDTPLDKKALKQPFLMEDSESLDPLTKFFHEILQVAFDIYNCLLINVCSQLDTVLVSSVFNAAASKGKKPIVVSEFINLLSDTIKMLKKHHLSETMTKQFIKQMFVFLDLQLFNNLMEKPELFTCTAGFQIKMAISQVESGVTKLDKTLNFVSKNLDHIKDAVNFLVMDKSIVNDAESTDIFATLNSVQLKHMVDSFKPDDLSPDPISESAKKTIGDAAKKNPDLPLEFDALDVKRINLTVL
ncbi:hypothetical protein PROFUN_03259 [Planoprotostelium fungivorum]|uniref:C2 NT-type domain-containing protein n=1 Tax=Planoprotostelium fungivorum TaxID=1890364 RepID=A0A2P6NWK7_9EUKA|nr:hypothetical protein PROFUN_03259 [Planoprotostelium fungivorum]